MPLETPPATRSRRQRARHCLNMRHLAATPVGRLVTGEAEVTQVDGRQIEFTVRATEGTKEIGAGSHSRVVIDVAKFTRRLNSRGGSNEQRLARLRRQFPAADRFGPRWTSSRPGDTVVRLSIPGSMRRLGRGAEGRFSGGIGCGYPGTALTRNSEPVARGRSPARGGGPLGCRRHRGRQQCYLVVRRFPRHSHHGFGLSHITRPKTPAVSSIGRGRRVPYGAVQVPPAAAGCARSKAPR